MNTKWAWSINDVVITRAKVVDEQVAEEKQLPINHQSRANLMTIRLGIFNNDSDRLSEQLYTGQITIGQWQEAMKAAIHT